MLRLRLHLMVAGQVTVICPGFQASVCNFPGWAWLGWGQRVACGWYFEKISFPAPASARSGIIMMVSGGSRVPRLSYYGKAQRFWCVPRCEFEIVWWKIHISKIPILVDLLRDWLDHTDDVMNVSNALISRTHNLVGDGKLFQDICLKEQFLKFWPWLVLMFKIFGVCKFVLHSRELIEKGMQSYKTDARGSCRFKPNDFNTVEEKELSSHHSW